MDDKKKPKKYEPMYIIGSTPHTWSWLEYEAMAQHAVNEAQKHQKQLKIRKIK